MYEHTIGVPLIMSGPGIAKNERRSAQCYLRDLFPTFCSLAGIDGPGDAIDGRSLQPVLEGTVDEIHPFVVGCFRDSQRMIRTTEWKFIDYPQVNRRQLFRLNVDPLELRDLSEETRHASIRDQLSVDLNNWLTLHGDSLTTKDNP